MLERKRPSQDSVGVKWSKEHPSKSSSSLLLLLGALCAKITMTKWDCELFCWCY